MPTATKSKKKTQEEPKPPEENTLIKRLFSQMIRAYPNQEGRLAIKFLWKVDDVHRFRANWWDEHKIIFSVFLRVREGMDGELKIDTV